MLFTHIGNMKLSRELKNDEKTDILLNAIVETNIIHEHMLLKVINKVT